MVILDVVGKKPLVVDVIQAIIVLLEKLMIILNQSEGTWKIKISNLPLFWRNKIKLGGAGYIYNRPPWKE